MAKKMFLRQLSRESIWLLRALSHSLALCFMSNNFLGHVNDWGGLVTPPSWPIGDPLIRVVQVQHLCIVPNSAANNAVVSKAIVRSQDKHVTLRLCHALHDAEAGRYEVCDFLYLSAQGRGVRDVGCHIQGHYEKGMCQYLTQ